MQPPTKPLSEIINKFIVENLLLIGLLCLVLFSAVLTSMASKSGDSTSNPFQRAASTILGVVLMSTIVGAIWSHTDFNPWFMAFLSTFLGIGAYRGSHWTMDLWEKSENWKVFFTKLSQIISAARKIANEPQPPTDTPTDTP